METAETRIFARYFRKTKAHPDGSVAHQPECGFLSGAKFCDCGLLFDLRAAGPAKALELYPLADIEQAEHDEARNARGSVPRGRAARVKKRV